MRTLLWSIAAVGIAAAAAIALFYSPKGPVLETVDLKRPNSGGPGLCPWRDPKGDLDRMFPGATSYDTDLLVLSLHTLEIKRRLGPGYHMDTTALYAYRARRDGQVVGTVLVRRAAGPHGALEVVVGVDPRGSVAGVRIQRLREPPAVSAAISSPDWLAAFCGKTADSGMHPGRDLPRLPPKAAEAGAVVAATVRALLVECQVGQAAGDQAALRHH